MSFKYNPLIGHKLQKKQFTPSDISELSDSNGMLFSGSYNDLSDKPTLFSGSYTELSGLPDLSQLHEQNTDFQIKMDTLIETEYFNNLAEPYKGNGETYLQTIAYKAEASEIINYLKFKTEALNGVENVVIDVFLNPAAGQIAGDDIYNNNYLNNPYQRKFATILENSEIKINFDTDIQLSANDIVIFVIYQKENVLQNKVKFQISTSKTDHVYNLFYTVYSGLELYFFEETANVNHYFAVGNETKKTSKAEATAAGIEIPGDLYIQGNIFQSGEATEVITERIFTANDFITMRDGAVSALSAGDISGLEVKAYDGANDLVFGTDQSGFFKVGEPNSLQTLATRENTPLDTGYAYWDAASFMFKTKAPDYNDLQNKPSLFSGSYNDLTDRPTLFSGSYNDLTDKPFIPSDVSDLSDNSNLFFSGSYNDLTDKPFIPSDVSDLSDNNNLFFDGNWASPINVNMSSYGSGFRHRYDGSTKVNTYVNADGNSSIFVRNSIGNVTTAIRSYAVSEFDNGVQAGFFQSADGSEGLSFVFHTKDNRDAPLKVTVKNGIITNRELI